MTHLFLILTFVFNSFSILNLPAAQRQAPSPGAVVRSVLFYSPNCGHCHYVITEVFPTLTEQYGEQLQIIGIDTSQELGQTLFRNALEKYGLDVGYVPMLVIGDTYLVGSADIPNRFPELIEQYLAQGGVDWPAIPGLAEALAYAQTAESPTATPKAIQPTPQPTALTINPTATFPVQNPKPTNTPGILLNDPPPPSLGEKLERDPLGNSLAILVLIVMIFSVLAAMLFSRWIPAWPLTHAWNWAIPILCLIGMGIAGYLAYVETTQVQAVCGPVGDCNTVQQSEYARLFGFLPIGILGLAGYVVILLSWGVGRYAKRHLAAYASLALLGLTTFGLMFSIYLTYLEPFVIGATCAWCLTSAILMNALFWLSLPAGRYAITYLMKKKKRK